MARVVVETVPAYTAAATVLYPVPNTMSDNTLVAKSASFSINGEAKLAMLAPKATPETIPQKIVPSTVAPLLYGLGGGSAYLDLGQLVLPPAVAVGVGDALRSNNSIGTVHTGGLCFNVSAIIILKYPRGAGAACCGVRRVVYLFQLVDVIVDVGDRAAA